MKRIILSLAFLFYFQLFLFGQSGSYRVVRVVGHVESSVLKRALKTEDLIPDGDHLKFKSKQDYLIIFHPKSGRKRIQGVPDEQPRELNSLIQSFLKPDEKSTGTRAINEVYVEKLKTTLKDTVLILGEGVIELDPKKIELKSPASIKAVYNVPGQKEGATILVLKGNAIHLGKEALLPSHPDLRPEVLLLYFLKDSSDPLEAEDFLGHFVPLYEEDAVLLPEVKAIVETMKGKDIVEIEKQVSAYLFNEYAMPQPDNLHAWLAVNKLLPGK